MKRGVVWMVFLVLACATADAGSSGYGVALGYGRSQDDIDVYRLGLQKEFGSQWLENSTGYLSGYFELSCNLWRHSGEKTHGGALSPVFVYYFDKGNRAWVPYAEAGIGVALIDDEQINGRNLATHFQFEDRIGVGIRSLPFDLNFRYMHYSNGSITKSNDGIDILLGTLSWYF